MNRDLIIPTTNMSREEWLRHRKKGVGGSDISAIMGINKWKSKIQLYVEKTSDEVYEIENEYVYWGNVLEEVVAKEFEVRTGKKVRKRNAIVRHAAYPYFYANVDRLVVGENAILECKTTNEYNKSSWHDGLAPESYILQCQWYMFILGMEKAYIACLIGGNKYVYTEIERNDTLINIMVEHANYFWNEHVLKGIPPEVDGSESSTNLLKKMFPKPNGKEIDLSEIDDLLENLEVAKEALKTWKDTVSALENKVKMYVGENEYGKSKKFTLKFGNRSRNSVDTKTLKTDHPDIYEKYNKIINYRTLIVKKENE